MSTQLATASEQVAHQSAESGHLDFLEGVKVRLNPAPIPKRVMAFAADLGLITAVSYAAFYVIYFVGIFFFGALAATLKDSVSASFYGYLIIGLIILLVLTLSLGTHAYFIYMENKYGHTFGKKIFGLRVVSLDGRKLKLSQLIMRDVVRWYVDFLFFLPGFLSMLMTDKKQRLGDLAAGTMVIHSKDKELENQYLYISQNHYKRLSSHVAILPLPSDFSNKLLEFTFKGYKKGIKPQEAEVKAWADKCKPYMPNWNQFNLNDETIIKYLAEHCYQNANDNK